MVSVAISSARAVNVSATPSSVFRTHVVTSIFHRAGVFYFFFNNLFNDPFRSQRARAQVNKFFKDGIHAGKQMTHFNRTLTVGT